MAAARLSSVMEYSGWIKEIFRGTFRRVNKIIFPRVTACTANFDRISLSVTIWERKKKDTEREKREIAEDGIRS